MVPMRLHEDLGVRGRDRERMGFITIAGRLLDPNFTWSETSDLTDSERTVINTANLDSANLQSWCELIGVDFMKLKSSPTTTQQPPTKSEVLKTSFDEVRILQDRIAQLEAQMSELHILVMTQSSKIDLLILNLSKSQPKPASDSGSSGSSSGLVDSVKSALKGAARTMRKTGGGKEKRQIAGFVSDNPLYVDDDDAIL